MEGLAEFVDRGDLCCGELAYDIRLMEVTPLLQLMRRHRVILIVLTLFAVAMLSLGAVMPRMRPMRQAKDFLVHSIGRQAGFPLSIGSVDITATGKLRLSDVRMQKGADGAQVTAQAEEVIVGLNLWRLLLKRDYVNAVSSVHVRGLYVDLAGESAELAQLLPGQAGESGALALPFPVTVSDVTATWQGYTWHERQAHLSTHTGSGLLRISLMRSSVTGAGIPTGYSLAGSGMLSPNGIQQVNLVFSQGFPSGSVTVTGALSWGENAGWQLKINGKNVRLAPWAAEDLLRPFHLEAAVTGPFRAPEVVLSTSTLVGSDWQIDSLQAELVLPEFNAVRLKSLTAMKKQAAITLSGTIPLTALDQAELDVKVAEITSDHLPQRLATGLLNGTASVTARVHGLAPGWRIDGTAIVRQGRLFDNAFTTIKAQFQMDARQVAVTGGTAYIAGVRDAAYRFSGDYLFAQRHLDAGILAAGIPAQHALAWIKADWHAQGALHGEVRISGPIDSPAFKIIATASAGEFWRQPFRRLRLDLEYAAGTVALRGATAVTADGEMFVTGHIRNGEVDLAFSVTDAALDQAVQAGLVHAQHYAPSGVAALQKIVSLSPTGRLTAQGTIKGRSDAPRLTAEFAAAGTRLAGATAGDWSGQVTGLLTGSPGMEPWRLADGQVRLGTGMLTVSGAWFIEPPPGTTYALALSGGMTDLPLKSAAQLAQTVNRQLGGANLSQLAFFDVGTVAGTWSLQLPHIKVAVPRLTADLVLNGESAGFAYQARISGYGWRNDVQFRQIRIAAAGGTADLKGAVVDNDLQVTGTWNRLPAGIIAQLAGLSQQVGGILSGDIDIRSTQGKLQGTLAWHTPQISVEDSQLTEVSGRITANNGRLQLTRWQGTLGGRSVQLSGSLPIPAAWGNYFGTSADQRLDLTVSIPQGPLAPLVSWLQLVPSLRSGAATFSGMQAHGEMHLSVGGTLQAPQLTGSAQIAQGVLPLPAPWGSIEQIAGRVEFTGDTVRLTQASAHILGGQVTAQGEMTLKGRTSATLQGTLTGTLKPKLAGVSGEGKLNLQIGGTLANLLLSGKVQVSNTEIDLTNLPEIALGSGAVGDIGGINGRVRNAQGATLGVNIDIAVDQVRVKAASLLDVPAKGSLQLSGTLADPRLNGVLRAERGRVNYLGTFFTVEEATATFAGYQGFMPAVNLIGTTWVGHTTIALKVNGILPRLQFGLASEPYHPQAEIVAMLGWPDQIGKVGSGNPNMMAQGIVEVLQGGIELGLVSGLEETVRVGLGLDEFRIHPSLAERRVRLSFGKYLLPRIYLTYETGLFGEGGRDLNLEYQLDGGWKMNAGVRNDGEMRFGIETKIRF
jgi:autotransporter translocation and assembly factor TamB